MVTTDILDSLGLAKSSSQSYLALLQLGTASAQEVAIKAHLPRTTAYSSLQKLAELGLIKCHSRRPVCYQALHPNSINKIIQNQWSSLQIAMPILLERFHQAGQTPRVKVFEGREGTKLIWEDTLRIPNKTIRNIDAMPNMNIYRAMDKDFMDDYVRRRIDAQVSIKEVRYEAEGVEKVWPDSHRDLREVHYVKPDLKLLLTILMYDGSKVAFLDPMAATYGVLIESADLYKTMENLFEELWRYTKPALRVD